MLDATTGQNALAQAQAFQEVSAFFIIIIVLMFRPHGLFGRKPVHLH